MKMSVIISVIFAICMMAIVADIFGSFLTALFGIVCYYACKKFEDYVSSIDV